MVKPKITHKKTITDKYFLICPPFHKNISKNENIKTGYMTNLSNKPYIFPI